jgi:hypothetical protein
MRLRSAELESETNHFGSARRVGRSTFQHCTSSFWKLSMTGSSTGVRGGCVTGVHGSEHDHGVVPVRVHGQDHGADNVDGHDHLNVAASSAVVISLHDVALACYACRHRLAWRDTRSDRIPDPRNRRTHCSAGHRSARARLRKLLCPQPPRRRRKSRRTAPREQSSSVEQRRCASLRARFSASKLDWLSALGSQVSSTEESSSAAESSRGQPTKQPASATRRKRRNELRSLRSLDNLSGLEPDGITVGLPPGPDRGFLGPRCPPLAPPGRHRECRIAYLRRLDHVGRQPFARQPPRARRITSTGFPWTFNGNSQLPPCKIDLLVAHVPVAAPTDPMGNGPPDMCTNW